MSSSKDLCGGMARGLDRKVFGLWSWCTDWAQWHLCCGSWPRAKNFPIQPDQTQSISILSYDHWFVKNFEKFCVDRIVRSNKWVHATKNIRLTNFPFFFSCQYKKLSTHQIMHFFSCFQFVILVFFVVFFSTKPCEWGNKRLFQNSSHQPVFFYSFLLDRVCSN